MAQLSLIFNIFYLLSSLVISGAHGVNIQVYKHENFTGLLWESNSTGNCSNVHRDKITDVYSIRTNACFIAYSYINCKSAYSTKYLPGDIIVSSTQLGRARLIESFQTCNEEDGGDMLNVDITNFYQFRSVSPDVLESYKNVCKCVNVPQYIQNMTQWSINNHHNDMLAYFEPDCLVNKWKPKLIEAGQNSESRFMHLHRNVDPVSKATYKIQSFGPDLNSTYFQTSCSSPHVVTTKIMTTIESATESAVDPIAGLYKRFRVVNSQIGELKTQVELLKRNQQNFQSEILQQVRNLTAQFKFDLHQLYA